ncbi:hypothetical protein H558_14895 [Bordetella holmesii H558]|nr:hypothetical protein H558_14895 [Bordetella holmesii H558]AOB37309.1 hypothetical protein BBB42_08665 [Bordetella holmesii]
MLVEPQLFELIAHQISGEQGLVGLDLQLIGRRHVDRYGPDLLGNPSWQLFEEGSGRLARAAITDP